MRDDRGASDAAPSGIRGRPQASGDDEWVISRYLNWWWSFTAPKTPRHDASFAERERARVGRLTSAIVLGVIALSAISLPTALGTPILSLTGAFSIGMSCSALVANRKGMVTLAAILLLAATDIALIAGVWFLPDQKLSLIWLFVAIVVIAGSLLPPLAMFPLVLAQCAFVLLDFKIQPNTDEYMKIRASGNYIVLLAPILGQLFIALVSYLWASSASHALQRADRAEELMELQQREVKRNVEEAERKRELEQGIAQMQAVLSQLANGNFHARVQPLRDAQLWQLGNTLNHFIGRLARMGQCEFTLKRTEEESRRLVEAIHVMRSGRQPIWPVVSGTPLDRVIEALPSEMSRNASAGIGARLLPPPQSPTREGEAERSPSHRPTPGAVIVTGSLLPGVDASTGATPSFSDLSPTQRKTTPSAPTDRRAPASGAGNPRLALPAPEQSISLPSWLMRQQLFRASDMSSSQPSQPPRHPKNSLPRVRLICGSLPEGTDGVTQPEDLAGSPEC